MAPTLHFIDVTADPRTTRKAAYQHRRREAHAQRRRAQTLEFQTRSRDREGDSDHVREVVPYEAEVPRLRDILSSARRDPFSSLARPLKPREHLLFDNYVWVVLPHNVAYCVVLADVKDRWLSLALTDPTLLVCTVFLATCRHFSLFAPSAAHRDAWMLMAAQYKTACVRDVRAAISAQGAIVDDKTIAQVLALALDELSINMPSASCHARAALAMAELKGGPEKLGLNGLLNDLLGAVAYREGLTGSPFWVNQLRQCGPPVILPAKYG